MILLCNFAVWYGCIPLWGAIVLAGRVVKYVLRAMSESGLVCGLVMTCCEFELLVRNWVNVTLACTCPVQVEGMCASGLCDCLDYSRAGSAYTC